MSAPRLENKCALVTGAASGIGFAIAQRFHEEGAIVVLADINESQLAGCVSLLGEGSHYVVLDVGVEAQWKAAFQFLIENDMRLDILVNNAGIPSQTPLEDTTLQEWRKVMTVNLDGVFLGCKYAVKSMKETGGGVIVNVSSVGALKGSMLGPAYGASKAGVWNLSKTVALYCARSGYGIRCNSLHPGLTKSPMMDAAPQDVLERLEAAIPMASLGVPADMANAALYLASDEARYTTGTSLVVDGGYTV